MIARKLLIAAVACVPLSVLAQDPPQRFTSEHIKEATATVESVDADARVIVLRDEAGRLTFVVAGPEIRNLAQIERGDRVVATWREATLAEVMPRGERPAGPRGSVAKARAAEGQRPGVGVGATISTTVTIDSVDSSFDTVRFKRSDGIVRTVAVEDPDAVKFVQGLQPGDEVQVTYTEATALSVVPAQD